MNGFAERMRDRIMGEPKPFPQFVAQLPDPKLPKDKLDAAFSKLEAELHEYEQERDRAVRKWQHRAAVAGFVCGFFLGIGGITTNQGREYWERKYDESFPSGILWKSFGDQSA